MMLVVLFLTMSYPTLEPTQPSVQWVPGALPHDVKHQGRKSDHSPLPMPSIRIHGAIPPYLHKKSLLSFIFRPQSSLYETSENCIMVFWQSGCVRVYWYWPILQVNASRYTDWAIPAPVNTDYNNFNYFACEWIFSVVMSWHNIFSKLTHTHTFTERYLVSYETLEYILVSRQVEKPERY
jgi:hypothetical protein